MELQEELDATMTALAQLQAGLDGLRRIAATDSLCGEMARQGLDRFEHPMQPYVRPYRRRR